MCRIPPHALQKLRPLYDRDAGRAVPALLGRISSAVERVARSHFETWHQRLRKLLAPEAVVVGVTGTGPTEERTLSQLLAEEALHARLREANDGNGEAARRVVERERRVDVRLGLRHHVDRCERARRRRPRAVEARLLVDACGSDEIM